VLDIPLGLAFTAGMVATVNPCGFAMLPAYLGFFLGSDDSDAPAARRALLVSLAMTAGFVAVFGIVGLAVRTVASSLDQHLAKATVVVGVVLVVLGVWLLTGHELRIRGPKIERGGRDRSFGSMFWFGVSYATASLSCTLGPFLVVVTPTFRTSGIVAGTGAFVTYALGMGSVITVATVAIAGARRGVVTWLRKAGPLINRVSGALLVVAGLYVTWYGWWDLRGDFDADPIVDGASRFQTWLTRSIAGLDPRLVATGAVAVVIVIVVVGHRAARSPRRPAASRETGKASDPDRVPSP
jgi:cytochrome c biogenesis protein CcdA